MPLTPALIHSFGTSDQSLSVLRRIPLDKPPYDERWLQSLINQHPELVPAEEVESSFSDIVPIVCELPLGSGYLDNLYFTPTGYPVLVEVKLWKNQEARRKVVTQILEYAKDFAGLKYNTLNDSIRKLRSKEALGDNPLFELVSRAAPDSPSETDFVDRVSRNLREGRFLLLILGDGVRDDMESLANHLMHHSLRYSFGIVQIRLYTMPDGAILALPDVMARTQTIERHVTVVTSQGTELTVTESGPGAAAIVTETKTSISGDRFYEWLGATAPEQVAWIKGFVQTLSDLSIETQIGSTGESLMLKRSLANGDRQGLIYFNPPYVDFWGPSINGKLRTTTEGPKIIRTFLERIAAALPGASVKVFDKSMDIRINGSRVPLSALKNSDQALREAISQYIQEANALLDEA